MAGWQCVFYCSTFFKNLNISVFFNHIYVALDLAGFREAEVSPDGCLPRALEELR